MNVVLYNNQSDNRVLDKILTEIKTVSAEFFKESSVLAPQIILKYDASLLNCNYLYISYMTRYYYVSDVTILDGGRMMLTCKVDVLKTYASQIKNLTVIVDKQKSIKDNTYYNDGSYVIDDRQTNNVINFPNSLLTDGQYILITAGG